MAEHRDIYMFHEEDNINLIKSGKMWYGEVFSDQVSYDFNFELPHLDFEYPVFFRANLVARSTEDSHFDISAEGVQIPRKKWLQGS